MANEPQQFSAPAIVIGGGINALGVVRSLGQAGVPVIVLDTDRLSPAMRSRYGSKRLVAAIGGVPLMDDLKALAAELGGQAVLFLTDRKGNNVRASGLVE